MIKMIIIIFKLFGWKEREMSVLKIIIYKISILSILIFVVVVVFFF